MCHSWSGGWSRWRETRSSLGSSKRLKTPQDVLKHLQNPSKIHLKRLRTGPFRPWQVAKSASNATWVESSGEVVCYDLWCRTLGFTTYQDEVLLELLREPMDLLVDSSLTRLVELMRTFLEPRS